MKGGRIDRGAGLSTVSPSHPAPLKGKPWPKRTNALMKDDINGRQPSLWVDLLSFCSEGLHWNVSLENVKWLSRNMTSKYVNECQYLINIAHNLNMNLYWCKPSHPSSQICGYYNRIGNNMRFHFGFKRIVLADFGRSFLVQSPQSGLWIRTYTGLQVGTMPYHLFPFIASK